MNNVTLWIHTSDGKTHSVRSRAYDDLVQMQEEFERLTKEISKAEYFGFKDDQGFKRFFTKHIVGIELTIPNEYPDDLPY